MKIFKFFIWASFAIPFFANASDLNRISVLSLNCCVEGFTLETYASRVAEFVGFLSPRIKDKPYIIGLQEIHPFEGYEHDISKDIVKSLTDEYGIPPHHFHCDRIPHAEIVSGDTAIISNLLPGETPGEFILPSGQTIRAMSLHLTDSPYQLSYLIGESYGDDDGSSIDRTSPHFAKALEESARVNRGEALEAFLEHFMKDSEKPLVIVGDFNEPSHLDWTAGALDEKIYGHLPETPEVIEWPCTRMLHDHGFIDALRTVHPSPSDFRGYSYPATSSIPSFGPRARIDHILVKNGSVKTYESHDNELSDHHFIESEIAF